MNRRPDLVMMCESNDEMIFRTLDRAVVADTD